LNKKSQWKKLYCKDKKDWLSETLSHINDALDRFKKNTNL